MMHPNRALSKQQSVTRPLSSSLLRPVVPASYRTPAPKHPTHPLTRQHPGHAASSAAVADAEAPSSSSDSEPSTSGTSIRLTLRQPKAGQGINWARWIYIMSQKPELQAEPDDDEADLDAAPSEDPSITGSEAPAPDGASASLSFFSHWDNPAAHLPYLQDGQLVSAFSRAISRHADKLEGKVVLDLGCGPGHLAMMCAKAGAKHVYAVDGSEVTAALARQVVAANGLSSRITVLHSSGEELQLREQVDVIVSDCVGPMLLGGGMMRALALARKSLLRPGGIVLPATAELFVAGVDDRDYLMATKQQWGKVAGFDMSPAMVQVAKTPRLDTLTRSSQLFTTACPLLRLELGPGGGLSVKRSCQTGFSAPFTLSALREERLFALMIWVQAGFDLQGEIEDPIVFSADPDAPPTHQQQLLLNFPKSIRLAKGDSLTGEIQWRPSAADPRQVDIDLTVDYKGIAASASYTLPPLMANLAARAGPAL